MLAKLKLPNALTILTAAIHSESPDSVLRNAALRALGLLGDDKAVPVLQEWATPGKPVETRSEAITSLGQLQKENREITQQIASYLKEPRANIRFATILALGERRDPSAIPALEALLHDQDLSAKMEPVVEAQIVRLKEKIDRK